MIAKIRDWGALVAAVLAILTFAASWGSTGRAVTDLRADVANKADANIVAAYQAELLRDIARLELKVDQLQAQIGIRKP